MRKVLIKNVLDVDVDGLKNTTRFKVEAMSDLCSDESDYAEIVFDTVYDQTFTWNEIVEKYGNQGNLVKEIKNKFNIQLD